MNDTQKRYHLVNNAIGWLIGIIACAVYIMTAEATASWWDCGEYIATAYKVQVGHPPGAPTFQIFGRLFTLFTDPYHAAQAVNIMSAVCSGLGIMFLYWTITLLGKKLLKLQDLSLNNTKVWAVFASGVVGALAYTFTDTYWFSAVEGEVYAMSSFFTAVVFWAVLKWDEQADDKHSLRWIILISFLVGIAIGVHLLNLLTIPAIVYVVYFKKYPKTTLKGFIISGAISLALLAIVLWGIIPGIVNLSSDFDVFFVNNLHLGFNSGTFFYFLLIALFIVWGVWNNSNLKKPTKTLNIVFLAVAFLILLIVKIGVSNFTLGFFFVLLMLGAAAFFIIRGKNKAIVNASLMSFLMLVIGYSTFFILVIRANTNTPLNENAPKDAVAMRAYLGREQYGETPFLYGPYYTAGAPVSYEDDYPKYIRTSDKEGRDMYKLAAYSQKPVYDKKHCGIFPRMYSADASSGRHHPTFYQFWAGKAPTKGKPSFGQNMKFFNQYQMGWMYWRYFMWNFAGRQNDIQGHYYDNVGGKPVVNYTDGHWISGIKFVDEHRLGPQDNLPDYLANNKARNKYFMLPLLLGMIGLIYHCIKNRKDAFVTFIMFFMTGIAIAIYLNMPPHQPRERDYAFVGSFYFFSVWIGLGVYALYDWLTTKFEKKERNGYLIAAAACMLLGLIGNGAWFILSMIGVVLAILAFVKIPQKVALPLAFVLSMSVPIILAAENWDDHDRSEKYAARDFAKNYLGLLDKNSVLITFGDNDTFPLWYIQEVEGFRTDVRILNYTLSGMHWYVEQLYNKVYESDPLPFTLPKEMYGIGKDQFAFRLLKTDKPVVVRDQNGEPYIPESEYIDMRERDALGNVVRMEVTDALELVKNNPEKYTRGSDLSADKMIFLPTNKFKITLDKKKLVANGVITSEQAASMSNVIEFDIKVDEKDYNRRFWGLYRNQLMMLDILGTNKFERNINIMNVGYIKDVFPVVDRYSVDDGMVSLLVPYPTGGGRFSKYTDRTTDYYLKGMKDKDGQYKALEWGNLNSDIYVDPISQNMGMAQSQNFALLAYQNAMNGDVKSARALLEIRDKYFPKKNFPVDNYDWFGVFAYAAADQQVEAYTLLCDMFDKHAQDLKYYEQFEKYKDKAKDVKHKITEAVNRIVLIKLGRDGFDVSHLLGLMSTGARLTEAGEKAFIAADSKNADKLKAIDDFPIDYEALLDNLGADPLVVYASAKYMGQEGGYLALCELFDYYYGRFVSLNKEATPNEKEIQNALRGMIQMFVLRQHVSLPSNLGNGMIGVAPLTQKGEDSFIANRAYAERLANMDRLLNDPQFEDVAKQVNMFVQMAKEDMAKK
ncbi:MAG: DUF2723 domain-containing protein [Bacteroidales bacterium]|nr:DUF2723 domain-containing protein [Bacteroidales bacterium]